MTAMTMLRSAAKHSLLSLLLFVAMFHPTPAGAEIDLAVQAKDPSLFYSDITIDSWPGGAIGAFVLLEDGDHRIQVTGPPLELRHELGVEVFYAIINVSVQQSVPKVKTFSFKSYAKCDSEGPRRMAKEWPEPSISEDKKFPGAFRLEVDTPVLVDIERDPARCERMPLPTIARWAEMGTFGLRATSDPTEAEVWINGRFVDKTNATVNVPYRDMHETIHVQIRKQGLVACTRVLTGPHDRDVEMHCMLRTPGAH